MTLAVELKTELEKLTQKELIELMLTNINHSQLKKLLHQGKSKNQNKKSDKKPQQHTPGLGIEYEVHVTTYFALRLNIDPEIEDFKLRSNVKGFGNLDDLLIDIKTKSGENLYFAFQLKHKERSNKNLLPTNFEAKGDFNLEKYCEAFKKLNEENRKKYHFILYTNKNFDSSSTNKGQKFDKKHTNKNFDSSSTNEDPKFDMKQDECNAGRNFFDTSGDGKHLYKFEVKEETEDGKNVTKKDYEEFFSKFSLYTGQKTIKNLEKSILDILNKECYASYMDFFRRWHRGDFTDYKNKILDKKTLNVHLVDILLSSVAINYHLSGGQDGNLIFFEAMVQQFDITIIDASRKNFVNQLEENTHKYQKQINKDSKERMIRLAKDHKLLDKFTQELKEETKLKLMHYFYQKPLILDFNESSKDLIYEASKLCKIQENEIKLVILGRGIDARKFSHLKLFKNLSAVDEILLEETKRRCNLSLQGRNISFEEIFEDEIREFVTPREISQMLKGSFSIGENKENLPEHYIPRTVSATVFDIESVIKNSSRSTAIIFYYEDKLEELKISVQKIMDSEEYITKYSQDAIIFKPIKLSNYQLNKDIPTIILRKKCSRKQLNDIQDETEKDDLHSEIHSFKVIDGNRCLLLMSNNNISYIKKYKYTKMSVEEKNIHVFFNNSINVLCAQPGMGKSTLMKYLRNEYDPRFWTVMVDLKTHNQFLKSDNIEEVLKYFLELDNCEDKCLLKIRQMFKTKQKIVFFMDGVDEVEIECVDRVLKISKLLGEMGFRIWLASRQNLLQKLEQHFNIFSIEINELNEDQQKKYIENRLTSLYNKKEIEGIVEMISSNTNLANNRQILEIPLQLHIITQILLDNKSNSRENSFILTKMFEIFFDGKYKHYLAKVDPKHTHLLKGLELEQYEIVALHSVLDDAHFQKLKPIEKPLIQIKNWDFLGIITEVNSDKVVFEHLTYAEYFASKFLVKKSDKARILKEEIFDKKYQNLLLIFNIMLAEDSPLHLAVIYKDLSRIEQMEDTSMEDTSVVDKGGRNFLQVAACVATRHPSLKFDYEPFASECVVKDVSVKQFEGEDLKIKRIVSRVLPDEPYKNDEIFKWNSLRYALAAGALYIVEAILKKFEKPPDFYKMLEKYYSDEVVAYYCIRFGYHRLLSEILAKKSCHVNGIVSEYLHDTQTRNGNNSILNFLFNTPDRANTTKIVELLTGDNINKTVYAKAGYTFIHFAVFHEDVEFLTFLLQKRANVNVIDTNGWSPLFLAVEQNNLAISKLLVENGANVNIMDENGWSPLFLAVKHSNFEIEKLLVENGAEDNREIMDPSYP